MTQHFLSVTDPPLERKFLKAIISYYLHENDKLGLGLSESQIGTVCRILLCGNEPDSDIPQPWQMHEETILDDYHKKEFAIMDYLHIVSLGLRKQLGQYSTPIEIVRYILKSVEYIPSKGILQKRLIDPACGSGAFLGEACRIYLNALKKAAIPISEWYPMAVSAISGIDIDPKACFFTRLNLAMLLAPPVLEFVSRNTITELKPLPVYCADTLHLLASRRKGIQLFYDGISIPLEDQFDFVVGNPPYYKIKNIEQNIKDTFTESIYGHPNAYALFIHAGIEMLRTHGRLGFIVPRSMLSGLYFKNLREFIERKTAIKEIVNISDRKSIFDNVLHGTMILSLKRDKQNDEKINISLMKTLEDIRDRHRAIVVDRNKVIQRLNGTTVWFVADSLDVYNILSKIIKGSHLLSGQEVNYRAKTGQIVWNRVKPLLSTQKEPDTLPLVWATDVGKFSFSFNRMGTARPCFLKFNSKTKQLIVKGPCILVQRVTADEQPSRIVACIPEEFCKKERDGYFVENHLNIVQPLTENNTIDLYFILGVLNSEVVDFFFRAMNGNTQVSATELNLLPVATGKYDDKIADIAKEIQAVEEAKKNKLLTELNVLVAKAYGLNTKELSFIKRNLRGWKNENSGD
ncbi:MAG: Eco57I restriction-modification methylase domain-containing protein [Candidatus Loosdrechtia sp.]|uniref:Eco57I restriction-modification methylase domain-containing protein n=1 Tax=Candidatus Loosdrechtia sp. TaxID=3101272 RepID=UPI003A61F8AD|nr:MAG: N-6 DNA methylase [Candidatus Jettenia sp. AMX2]